jgi:exosortase/archaeosortase family protein
MEPSVWILNNLGFESQLVRLREIDMHDLDFNIVMLNPCLGIDMMFTFVALIVSFPGKWLDRLWFIPIGLVGIQAVNVCRVVGLSISLAVFETSGPIDHHDLYNLFAVGFIFLMFMAWVNRYEKKEPAP